MQSSGSLAEYLIRTPSLILREASYAYTFQRLLSNGNVFLFYVLEVSIICLIDCSHQEMNTRENDFVESSSRWNNVILMLDSRQRETYTIFVLKLNVHDKEVSSRH